MIHFIPLSDEYYKFITSSIAIPTEYLKRLMQTAPDAIKSTENKIPANLNYKLYLILTSEQTIESIIEHGKSLIYISSEIFILSNCATKTKILKDSFDVNIEITPTVYLVDNHHNNVHTKDFFLNFDQNILSEDNDLLRASTMLFFSQYVLEGAYLATKELSLYQRDLKIFKERGEYTPIDSNYTTDLIYRVFRENIILTSTLDLRRCYENTQRIASLLDMDIGLESILDSLSIKELIQINEGAPNVCMYEKTYDLICKISSDIRLDRSEPIMGQILICRIIRDLFSMPGISLRLDEKIELLKKHMKALKIEFEEENQKEAYDDFSLKIKNLITKHLRPNINTPISEEPIINSLSHWFSNTPPDIKITPCSENIDHAALGFIYTLISNKKTIFKIEKNRLFFGISLLLSSNPEFYEKIMVDVVKENVEKSPKIYLQNIGIQYIMLKDLRSDKIKKSKEIVKINEDKSSLPPQDEPQNTSHISYEFRFLSQLKSDPILQDELKRSLKSKADKIIQHLRSLEHPPSEINEVGNAKGVGDKAVDKVRTLFNKWLKGKIDQSTPLL